MNVLTPVPPSATWLQRLIFMVARAFPGTLSGLLGLSLIHFARWVLIKRDQWPEGDRGKPALDNDYMLFCSNFNGTWDQYIDAFADGIPNGLDLFWYASTKYPSSIPITSFKSYIAHNQFHTGYYYNATPGSAQRDIKAALKVYSELKTLAGKYQTSTSAAAGFAAEYNKFLAKVQNCLGSPGYAPIASLDTENADINRGQIVVLQAAKTIAASTSKTTVEIASRADTQSNSGAVRSNTTSFDGGHCFLTALLPIKTAEVIDRDGLRSSPVHMVRDALAILPTAHQSPVTQALPVNSPFTRNRKTHFARLAVIDDVIYNGRVPTDAILDRSDRTIFEPVDQLPCPYLMLVADFDAPQGTEAELRDYLREIWSTMGADLKPILTNCFRYDETATTADGFADYIIGCQLETTMPFNDYWPAVPPLPTLSIGMLVFAILAAAVVVGGSLYAALSALIGPSSLSVAAVVPIVLLGLSAGLYVAYWMVMTRGAKPFPAAPNSDLPSILKALYLQRALIAFAIKQQGASAEQLHAAFGEFLNTVRVNDASQPTQLPGTIWP